MAKYYFQVLILIVFFSSVTSFSTRESQDKISEDYPVVSHVDPAFISSNSSWADSVIATMSLDEKIAQMIMVAAYSNKGDAHTKEISYLIEHFKIGGIAFFQGGPVRQANLTNYFQSVSRIPLLIAQDAEWGLGMRLDSTISYPKQMTLGAIRDNELIYQMGYHIGNQLKRIGVHVNFAPVADVNNNPFNPVINFRSFGENQENVAEKSLYYARGLEDAGIIATFKHFPGHGDTNSDSHYTLPVILHTQERLDSIELFPFKYAFKNGVPAVMTAHLNIPALDSTENLASSLSYPVVGKLLKEKLAFKGLVFTDALSMKGVSDYFKPGELEARAFTAGNDILLMPSDVEKAITFIKREVRKGNIDEEEIDSRCRKILLAKSWLGLPKAGKIKVESIHEDINSPYYLAFNNELIRQSFTLARNRDSLVPMVNIEEHQIASLAIGTGAPDVFSETLQLYTKIDPLYISKRDNYSAFHSLESKLSGYNTLIISIQETSNRPSDNFGITQATIQFLKNLKFKGRIILVLFGNPYCLTLFDGLENVDALLVAYENSDNFKHLAAQSLFGASGINGVLPVSAGSFFMSGTSVPLSPARRLSYGFPEEVLMNSSVLAEIEILVNEAIGQKATPGCQVLVARHGKVVYNKAFGYHSYNGKKKVKTTDLYDLASITKIAATLPLLMQLYENKVIDINQGIGNYFSLLHNTDKADITISDILAHQAGLPAWIPFYYSLIEPLDTSERLFSNKLSAEFPIRIASNAFVNRNVRIKDDVYSDRFSLEFPIHVADRIFLKASCKDSLYQTILNSPVSSRKQYLYSDLGLYLLQAMIEEKTGSQFYPLLYTTFYSRLGASTLGYLPLNRFPKEQIVPTELDLIFRKQLLQGYVHDPGAAMLGGIAGHAGLFSNANDLAKMMQMYLNGGYYGGRSYISDTIINQFTACAFCNNGNRRGLGFDKPEPDAKKNGPSSKLASSSSYGHTGFTGTIVWNDPQYDLIYIFLSNRIHPDSFNQKLIELNIRTKIQDIIYNSLVDVNFARK